MTTILKRQHPTDEHVNAYPFLAGMQGDITTWTSRAENAFRLVPMMVQSFVAQLKRLPGDKEVKYEALEQANA